jgi:hypothetical protein
VRVGLWTGALAASSVAGVFVGFGMRRDAPGAMFRILGSLALGSGARATMQLVMGALMHVAWIVAWCVAVAVVAGSARGRRLVAISIGCAAVFLLFSAAMFRGAPPWWGPVFSTGHLVAGALVFGLTVGLGMRLASA